MERQRCPSLPKWDGMLGVDGGERNSPAWPAAHCSLLTQREIRCYEEMESLGPQIVSCGDCLKQGSQKEGPLVSITRS